MTRADDYPTQWTSTNQLGWSKQRLIYELQQELLECRTHPPGVTFDWFDPTIEQSRLDMAASTVKVIDGVFGFDNNFGIETRTIGIEVRRPPAAVIAEVPAAAAAPLEVVEVKLIASEGADAVTIGVKKKRGRRTVLDEPTKRTMRTLAQQMADTGRAAGPENVYFFDFIDACTQASLALPDKYKMLDDRERIPPTIWRIIKPYYAGRTRRPHSR